MQFPTQSLIYAPSQPVWIDRPANLVAQQPDAGLCTILSPGRPESRSRMGDRYEVKSELTNPTTEQLRAVGHHVSQMGQRTVSGSPRNPPCGFALSG